MTDSYLRSLGFSPTNEDRMANRPTFSQAWRYQNDHTAQDGTPLFVEHSFGVDSCRLSALPAPLDAHDVFATVSLNDEPALKTAVAAFYAAHGGEGSLVVHFVPHRFLPHRRAL